MLNEHITVFAQSGPLYATGVSLDPPESSMQTISRSLHPFLQGSLGVWQTDRPCCSVGNNRWSAPWRSQILLLSTVTANNISIAAVIFAGLTRWQTDWQTNIPYYLVFNNRRSAQWRSQIPLLSTAAISICWSRWLDRSDQLQHQQLIQL